MVDDFKKFKENSERLEKEKKDKAEFAEFAAFKKSKLAKGPNYSPPNSPSKPMTNFVDPKSNPDKLNHKQAGICAIEVLKHLTMMNYVLFGAMIAIFVTLMANMINMMAGFFIAIVAIVPAALLLAKNKKEILFLKQKYKI